MSCFVADLRSRLLGNSLWLLLPGGNIVLSMPHRSLQLYACNLEALGLESRFRSLGFWVEGLGFLNHQRHDSQPACCCEAHRLRWPRQHG